MQFVDGPTVADKIQERPLPLDEALDIAIQVAEGLHEAHEKDIVHRDIKAANILLNSKGQAKITDFGLAYLAERSKLTKSGTTLGTPAYMSPGQAQGQHADRRSDIWSLGVLLYEMITGRHPFPGEYEQAVVYSIINEAPEPMTALRSGLPTELDRVSGKAMSKSADERYQHVEEMLVDLRGLTKQRTSGKSTILRTPPAASSPSSLGAGAPAALAPQQPTAPAASSEELVPKRKLRLAWAVAAVAALVALAVSFLYFRQTAPEAPAAPIFLHAARSCHAYHLWLQCRYLTQRQAHRFHRCGIGGASPRDRRGSCGSRISTSGNRGRSTVLKEPSIRSGHPTVISSDLQPLESSRRSRFRRPRHPALRAARHTLWGNLEPRRRSDRFQLRPKALRRSRAAGEPPTR